MFARERPDGRVDGRRASTGRAPRKSSRMATAAGVFRTPAARGTSRRDIEETHYERHDLTHAPPREATYFAPHFRAASTNAWTFPSGVGCKTP